MLVRGLIHRVGRENLVRRGSVHLENALEEWVLAAGCKQAACDATFALQAPEHVSRRLDVRERRQHLIWGSHAHRRSGLRLRRS